MVEQIRHRRFTPITEITGKPESEKDLTLGLSFVFGALGCHTVPRLYALVWIARVSLPLPPRPGKLSLT